ncbi:sensor histidine kinase [Fulvivirga lutea]|uniref:histidine kinase n=1 Tax=Fulvivirga lutea TaxID=2810512 RepID=A0A974WNZ0_9BACT|nr:ATP-binding protein [Fulvivirga lutea]QSE98973.1 GHKL domain-containing protein [Fulvivirga lutea]
MIRNFRLNILLRILIITTIIGLHIYFLLVDTRYLRSVYLIIFLVIAIIEFVWYVDRTNRDFTSFLLALLQNDFTTKFSESGKGKSFNKLYSAFNKITQRFELISSQKEVQHLYLESLVDHVKVGILSFDRNERIHLMNRALQKLLARKQVAFLNNFSSVDPELPDFLREIKPNENKLKKIQIGGQLLQLSVHATEFKLGEDYYKLISFQNIKNELDSSEMEAWQKLIRVLTHEIMNSVTPITSLSETLKVIAENAHGQPEEMNKLSQGLDAIHQRSAGLQNFTEAYKKLTKIPKPNFQKVELKPLVERVLLLFQTELKRMKYKLIIDDNVSLLADSGLLEQVFINLIKNALEALEEVEEPQLIIRAFGDDKVNILIEDNGTGISDDKIDQIFIPFFTTKDEGSGIGLALCRQIIRLHNGTISVSSEQGKTVFEVII